MGGKYLSPDIYFEQIVRDERFRPLERAKLNVGAFLGIAEKGPIQVPTRITSWEAFKRTFGDLTESSFLAYAVFGFFNNGGSECYITRVAHVDDPDNLRNAATATTVLRDLFSRGTIQVDAQNSGAWGNNVNVQVGVPKRVHRTLMLHGLSVGATKAAVDVSKGFEVGDIVRFTDGKAEAFVRVSQVDRKEIHWEKPLETAIPGGKSTAEAVQFKLTVTGKDDFEIFDNLAMDPAHPRYFATVVNGSSKYVTVKDLRSTTEAPYNFPQAMLEATLEGGRDGSEWLTPEDYIGFSLGPGKRRGLMAYEEIDDVGLICMPDLMNSAINSRGFRGDRDVEAVQKAAIDYCTRNRYCFVILDPPPNLTPTLVQEWRDRFDSRFCAIYYPWIKVMDPFAGRANQTKAIPPCGHVAGIYAKMDDQVGTHKPPANEPMQDVIALERPVEKDTQDLLYPDGINCIRFFRGRGIRIWGSRTLSSDAAWRHVNVTRVFAMICKSIESGTQWAPFEPNNEELWKMLVRLISTFLTDLWRQGYLIGPTPEQAFYVKCDEETNPPEVRDAGEVICEIGVAIVRPLEFIVFRIGQRTKDIGTQEE
jgi:hypothetical protein